MPDQRAEDAIKRQEKLVADLALWQTHWQEDADRVLLRQAEFLALRTPGEKLMRLVHRL